MTTDVFRLAKKIQVDAERLAASATRLVRSLESDELPERWAFPVNDPANWYVAVFHDESGRRNNGYRHTGIDINLDKKPHGDVDRGQPIYSVCPGIVHAIHYSRSYLGGVVVKAEHEGKPLYIRYWHLANDTTFSDLAQWQTVGPGQLLGHIGNYRLGDTGDHLHFDMRTLPFYAHWWFTRHASGWVDPVPILKAHLDPVLVNEMLRKV
jgi:murein DD-endopeptidase MepM/ murein hydrolase activator NlpD